jgi:TolA-binding protein
MPISPDDAAIRDLLLQQGREVAPPVPGPATGGIGSLAPPVAPVGGINDEGIMRRMQEEQQRRMMEEQQRRMMEEQQRRMMEEQQRRMMEEQQRRMMEEQQRPMPPYDPRTGGIGKPMPPYDPRTGGVGKPIYDLLPVMPPMDDGH